MADRSIHAESIWNKPVSRRTAAGIIGGGFMAGTGAVAVVKKGIIQSVIDAPQQSETLPAPAPTPTETTVVSGEEIDKDLIHNILRTPPQSEARKLPEIAYVKSVRTLKEIDQGLLLIGDENLRLELIEKRYQLRKSGKEPNQQYLPSNQEDMWAGDHGIHPETLYMVKDARWIAYTVLTKLQQLLPQEFSVANVSDMLISAGGMAKLVCTETGFANPKDPKAGVYGLANIGKYPAITQFSEKNKEEESRALTTLCGYIAKDTGLPIYSDTVIGSTRPSQVDSGGAIGMQMMPSKALEMYKLFEDSGMKFNPFDATSSIAGAYVFLAREQQFSDGTKRYGWRKNSPEKDKRFALEKWNNDSAQAEKIYQAGIAYEKAFPSKQPTVISR